MITTRNVIIGLLCNLAGASAFATSAADQSNFRTNMTSVSPQELIDRVRLGRSVQVDNVALEGEAAEVTLELERFDVFAPNARIIVHEAGRKKHRASRPGIAYFRGTIQGDPDSLAVLSADPRGPVKGIVQQQDRIWILGGGEAVEGPATGMASRELRRSDASAPAKPFHCETAQLPVVSRPAPMALITPQALPPGQHHVVPVAIETDGEFWNLFGSEALAKAYVGELFAYSSAIYRKEIGAELQVSYLSLWSGGPTSDPWNHANTSQGLTNFGSYWNANRSAVKRAVAHFLSGRPLGGGIAWVGALCDNRYGYGYSANISGQFKLSNPAPVWDIIVVSHEIGHNFSSPHSHDYNRIGGNSAPIDSCYNSQTGRYGTLPGLGSLTGGLARSGGGTIMSYCHLLSGGYSNISLTFGLTHPYGIQADRESSLMSSYVAQVANEVPSCITIASNTQDPTTYDLTLSKIGNGRISSSPTGIDCGTLCSASFASGRSVILTARPDTGYTFSGWSGDCAGASTCALTMSANRSVTATFAAPSKYDLQVSLAGPGTVTSTPSGIRCGTACTARYSSGTSVVLTATPARYRRFVGWGGACAGTATRCAIKIDGLKSVTATFR